MDAHIIDRPDLQELHGETRDEIQVPDHEGGSLPDVEATDEHADVAVVGQPVARHEEAPNSRPAKRRMNPVAPVVGVAVVAGFGLLLASPLSPFRPHSVSGTRVVLLPQSGSRVLSPAASLATAPIPQPTPQPQTRAGTGSPAGDDMASFLQLGGHGEGATTPTLRPTQAASVRLPPVAQDAVTRQTSPVRAENPAAAIAALPASSAPPPPLPKVPTDPVAAVAALQPAKMTEPQQVQVLQLVTELGALVRDQRIQLAELRHDEQALTSTVTDSLSDYGRRLTLAEARGSVAAAMGGPAIVPALTPQQAVSARVTPATARTIVRASMPSSADAGERRYHVMAASPGMAMVSELDSSGGEERQLPISPGDDLPGYGRVESIAQRGTAWVVRTERGSIQ